MSNFEFIKAILAIVGSYLVIGLVMWLTLRKASKKIKDGETE